VDLWKTSGHFDFYRDSMFNQMDVDAEEYQVGAVGLDATWICLLAATADRSSAQIRETASQLAS
jgi:hypothetical protein